MGRELKRVALDFYWPINQIWEGFLNPYCNLSSKCSVCDGSGQTPEMKNLADKWYGYAEFKPEERGSVPLLWNSPGVFEFAMRNVTNSPDFYLDANNIGWKFLTRETRWVERLSMEEGIKAEGQRLADIWNQQWSHHLNADDVAALVEAGRLMEFTHTLTKSEGWKPKEDFVMPTPQEVNEWSLGGFGHDSINQWVVCKAEAKRLGIEVRCPNCQGEGHVWPNPEAKENYENWVASEPPEGEGYQMWENVTEGSPISPVFRFPKDLAQWLAEHHGDYGNFRQWMAMIDEGYAPSMILSGGVLRTGVQAALGEPEEWY